MMNLINKFSLCVLLTLSLVLIATEATISQELEKPLIDYLTLDYMSVEQSLWTALNRHFDKRTLFTRIRDEHDRFFLSDFGETNSLRSSYVPLAGALIENLQRLNTTFQFARVILHSNNGNELITDEIVDEFSRDFLRNVLQTSANIFREVSHADFWNKGKNVSAVEL